MQSMHSLLDKLSKEYPDFQFIQDNMFWWSAAQKIIHMDRHATHAEEYTLHETSHAILGHSGYNRDIDLVKLERDAWDYAQRTLGPRYGIAITEDIIQNNLGTYREWLYQRSMCPDCTETGIETRQHIYRCLACGHMWRVNEAKLCALRRYSLQTK